MRRNTAFAALALAFMLPLAACAPNVPEQASPTPAHTSTPTPSVTSTPEGILDDIGDTGKEMAEDIGDAAKDVTQDVKNGVSRALN